MALLSATCDTEIGFFSRSVYEEFAREHREVHDQIMTMLPQRLHDTDSIIAAASFLSNKGRVALAFVSLAEALERDVGTGRF